ncbi:MAG: AI-2E family transporter [Lachnospiraceae bacterium]|nr:AI-2E family transporter [Lachnospiraceae bacterium]
MKWQINKRYFRIGLMAFAVIAASICFYYLIFHGDRFSAQINSLIRVVNPVLYGIVFAYLMTPMVNGIERQLLIPLFFKNKTLISSKQKKYMRFFSIILTMIVVILMIYGFFSILIPNILKSIRSISYQFPYYVQNLINWSYKFLDDNPDIADMVIRFLDTYSEKFLDYINNNIMPQMETLVKQVSLSLISVLKVLWNFIIGMIISIYVLYNKETFAGQGKKLTYAFLSTKTANQFIQDIRFTSDTFIGFISGKIIDSIIIGFICFAGTSILKTPYALLVSVIVGVTNVIPFFGPYLGAIPSAILILMVNPIKCIYFIIFIVILQQIDGNIIGPKILGQSTGLSGFWVIFSITVFGGIMGIPGMIIGVPFFAVIYAMIKRITNRMLSKKGLPTETSKYLDVHYIDDNDELIARPVEQKNTFFKLRNKKNNSESTDSNSSEREQ